jgi:high-affinity Fe2+/Pb2+ permease
MYEWIWRHLPGPTPVKALQALALFALVVLVLFVFVFPWMQQHLPFTSVTIDSSAPGSISPFTNRGI